MAKLTIYPIPLMVLARPMAEAIFRHAQYVGQVETDAVFVWYIKGTKKNIVVDCGMTADMMKKAFIPTVTHIQTLEEGLAKVGLKPSDVDLVIATHLHLDHIPLAPKFTNAKFLVQKVEMAYHRNPPPLPVDPRPCPKELLDTLNWEVVDGDYEVEKGLKVLFTPGHTPGGQSVAVETAKGLAIIDSLCTTDRNWDVPPALGPKYEVLVPATHRDPLDCYNSLMRIKKMADIIVPLHEMRLAFTEKIG